MIHEFLNSLAFAVPALVTGGILHRLFVHRPAPPAEPTCVGYETPYSTSTKTYAA